MDCSSGDNKACSVGVNPVCDKGVLTCIMPVLIGGVIGAMLDTYGLVACVGIVSIFIKSSIFVPSSNVKGS